MKTKLLMLGICATMLFACKDDKKTETKALDPEKMAAEEDAKRAEIDAKYKDSIQKAEVAEAGYFKQDSIDALGIKGYKVKLVSGKHKYGGKTTIEYESLHQVLAETRAKAKKENTSKEDLDSNIKDVKGFNKGGRIILNVERPTIGAANNENFTIIIKDKDDKEISKETLENDIPEYSSSDYWWNIAVRSIGKKVQAPFYIYVEDILQDEPFKFEVTPIKK